MHILRHFNILLHDQALNLRYKEYYH